MKHQDTELTKMEAIVILLDLGRTADERTCRAAMLGAKALARHLKHRAACHASRVARGLPACHAPKITQQEESSHEQPDEAPQDAHDEGVDGNIPPRVELDGGRLERQPPPMPRLLQDVRADASAPQGDAVLLEGVSPRLEPVGAIREQGATDAYPF